VAETEDEEEVEEGEVEQETGEATRVRRRRENKVVHSINPCRGVVPQRRGAMA
jgi:hypothetical protein